MDLNPSPEHLSPEIIIPKSPYDDATTQIIPHRNSNSPDSQSSQSPDSAIDNMATMVVQSQAANMPGPLPVKRYRPAPAKTFQCRGYGECRMVFSRSEHLARHIRKHTGERPFSCHCGKQFSRLDNLRQHAQTVHADKQEQNERMMRDLTSLHATMAAANKVGTPRGGRRPPTNPNPGHQVGGTNGGIPQSMNLIKQEELPLPIHQRPGTSTGYEGDLYPSSTASWHVQASDLDRPHPRSASNHSFRDSNQSFLASQSTSPSAVAAQSHSFRAYSGSLNFLSDSSHDGRPRSASRPPTSSGSSESHSRSLPPLSAVVSASLSSASSQQQQQQQSFASASAAAAASHQQQQQQQQQQSTQHVLPFPPPLGLRRPSTATRPGTAPASAAFFSSKSSFLTSGTGLVNRSELPLSGYGRGPSSSYTGMGHPDNTDYDDLPSPQGQDSPFYFHPPSLPDPQSGPGSTSATTTSPSSLNPRKRAFAGPDGPYDDASSSQREPPNSSSGLDYEYGSESRPQSRRLSVMELCNDTDSATGSGAFLLSAANHVSSGLSPDSRPTTSSGLVSSASALHIFDRNSPVASPPLLSRAQVASTGSAISGNGGSGSSGSEEFGGGGIPATIRRIPAPAVILPFRTGSGTTASSGAGTYFTHSPTFSTSSAASYSPRSPTGASTSSFSPRSPISGADANAATAISRRGNGEQSSHDQVRTFSPHSSTALGMSV